MIGTSVKRITAGILLLVMLTAGGCTGAVQKTLSGSPPEIVKRDGWTEVGKEIVVFTSDFYLANMALVISGKEAVLVDTGMFPKDGEKIQDFLKERELSLKHIIITHMHADHAANIEALEKEGAVLITPENSKNNQIVKLGDKTLKVIFTEGHYKEKGHVSVEIAEDNILIAGDIICNNILPPIAAGGSLEALLDTLKELEGRNYPLIIPGHGELAETGLLLDRQFEYLNNAKEEIEKVIASGGNMKDLQKIKLEDCIKDTSYLYEEKLEYWHRQSLQTIYLQLKKSN